MPRRPKGTVAAEVTLTLRLTEHDRALLDRLVDLRREELAELGADEVDVTAASYVRALIRREAKAKGVTIAPPAVAPAPRQEAAQPAKLTPEDKEAADVHAALLRALESGEVQAKIAERAGVDAGALSKFKKTGGGLSPEKVRKLKKVL